MQDVSERADGAMGNARATDDEKIGARAREREALYRKDGTAGHHEKCVEVSKAANAVLSNTSSTIEEKQEAFVRILAVWEVAPASARLGVEDQWAWRAREQAIRTMAREARVFVPWTRAFSATRPTAPSVIEAMARAVFPRGKLLQAPAASLPELRHSSATLGADDVLILRDGLDSLERASALAWGLAVLAMRRAKASGVQWDPNLEIEAADRLALAVVQAAGDTASKLLAVMGAQ